MTIRVDGRFIHSRRDPQSEARRFLLSQARGRYPRVVLIVGAGLSYLVAATRAVCPSCRVLTLHLSEETRRNAVSSADEGWSPASGEDISHFLSRSLHEEDFPALLTLFWKPALDAFPETADTVSTAVHEITKRLQASLSTAGYFGARWFHNAVVNYLSVEQWIALDATTRPVVVVAPGPSLSCATECIRAHRGGVLLVAVASAAEPLIRDGLAPDLIVHQDAGFFSGEHLRRVPSRIPRIQPMSAKPTVGSPTHVAWLDYDHPLDELLRHSTGERSAGPRSAGESRLIVPQLGTVTATAVHLARRFTSNSVFLAGVDMASRDLHSHARGHAFEGYHQSRSSRSSPYLQLLFSRLVGTEKLGAAEHWRLPPDLDVYAEWFRSAQEKNGLYRLCPSPVDLGVPEAGEDALRAAITAPAETSRGGSPEQPVYHEVETPTPSVRQDRLRSFLEHSRGLVRSELSAHPRKPPARHSKLVRSICRQVALAEYLRLDRLERIARGAPDRGEDGKRMEMDLSEAHAEVFNRVDAVLSHTLHRLEELAAEAGR